MTVYVALLRGVNVGGRAVVTMADLRDVLTGLGLRGARTVLQSGNAVFATGAITDAKLERRLEDEFGAQLGLHVDVIVRSAAEWDKIIAANPFTAQAERDPSHVVVLALKTAPSAADVDALRSAVTGPEEIVALGRQLYITYPEGIGRSRLTNALIEKKLALRGTARNWNTVLKLRDAMRAPT